MNSSGQIFCPRAKNLQRKKLTHKPSGKKRGRESWRGKRSRDAGRQKKNGQLMPCLCEETGKLRELWVSPSLLPRRRLEEILRKEEFEKQEREERERQKWEEEMRREEEQRREREEQKRLELERLERERLERERLEQERQQREKEELERRLVHQRQEEERQRKMRGERTSVQNVWHPRTRHDAEEARVLQPVKGSWSVQQEAISPLHGALSLAQIQKEEHIQAVKEQVCGLLYPNSRLSCPRVPMLLLPLTSDRWMRYVAISRLSPVCKHNSRTLGGGPALPPALSQGAGLPRPLRDHSPSWKYSRNSSSRVEWVWFHLVATPPRKPRRLA